MRHFTAIFIAVSVSALAPTGGSPGSPGPVAAHAQGAKAQKDVEVRNKQAMENFDLLEFEAAKTSLDEAVALARKNKMDKEPLLARVYLNLGIVQFAGLKNTDAAREAFAAAVAIDPKIQIGVAYRTEAMSELLAAVKKGDTGAAGGIELPPEDATGAGADCATLEGVDHTLVEQGRPGAEQTISARVGDPVGADKVSVYYRAAGAKAYSELPMEKGDDCTYEGAIPASDMKGESVHYYVAAQKGGEIVGSKGSRGSPNIIELAVAGAGGPDGENPPGASVSAEVEPTSGDKPTIFVSVAVGTGGGYVTGTTEVAGSDVGCCFAPALLHLFPEIGYYLSRQTSLSVAFRMGFAVGANVPRHASAAPAGLLRLRYALDESGTGLQFSGAVGGGIIRHTVKVETAADGMNVDTTASGPFLAGAGMGYAAGLSSAMQFVAELNGLAAFPGGIKELGGCPGSGCVTPHFGLQFDINLGVLFAF